MRNVGAKSVRELPEKITSWLAAEWPLRSADGESEIPTSERQLEDGVPSGVADLDGDGYLLSPKVRSALLRPAFRNRLIPTGVISARGYNALTRARILTLGDFASVRLDQFNRMSNVGVQTVDQLAPAIASWIADEVLLLPIGLVGEVGGPGIEDDEGQADQRPDLPLMSLLPQSLQAELNEFPDLKRDVSAGDVRFGVRRLIGSLQSLLDSPFSALDVPIPSIELIAARLELLVERVRRPIPLIDELKEVLPGDDRATQMLRSRWGWDGTGPKTLDAAGKHFGITRERVRQIEAKEVKHRLPLIRAYLPTAEALIELLRALGGAAYEDDFGEAAVVRGLARARQEVAALPSLAALGWVSERGIRRTNDLGPTVLSLGSTEFKELVQIGSVTRRVLRRRGIASISEVIEALEREATPASEREVRSMVGRIPGVEYLGNNMFFWQPDDADSSFTRTLEKPLAVLGPLTTNSLGRAMRRAARRETYGPVITTAVFLEALRRSPYFEVTDGRCEWRGPNRPVSLGVAEEPLLELLRAEGPVMTGPEIREALPHVESITLSLAFRCSPLVERVGHALYALAGAYYLPGDIEDASSRARDATPSVHLMGDSWTDGALRVDWQIFRQRIWSKVLPIPARLGLDGDWKLEGWREDRPTRVQGAILWGGVGAWVADQEVGDPVQLTLRFDMSTRTITPSIRTLAGP